jgi:hypothetical protein
MIPLNLPSVLRGVRKTKPILCDENGRPWRVHGDVVDTLMLAETRGEFDEMLMRGDRVRIKGALGDMEALMTGQSKRLIGVLSPLFGGSRMTIPAAKS